tara:strand:+ start:257 stop:664 length:408 start_codon:yes stop_codon:yes gene_type:complete
MALQKIGVSKMKTLICSLLLLTIFSSVGYTQEKKIIQAPRVVQPPKNDRPQGFGKQEWQQRQQRTDAIERLKAQQRYEFGFGGYNYYRPVNPHFRYYRVPSYYPPVIIRPPVIIQPRPVPIYPAPFSGFFFQFRF